MAESNLERVRRRAESAICRAQRGPPVPRLRRGPWYHDGNGGGWIDPSSTSYVFSNRYAMRVGLPSNNALAILRVVASNYMDTTGFTNLEFWINGGPTNTTNSTWPSGWRRTRGPAAFRWETT